MKSVMSPAKKHIERAKSMARRGAKGEVRSAHNDLTTQFVFGFLDGLSSPAFFITGDLERLHVGKISTAEDSWKKVGQQIRSSAERYRAKRA
jgi:hypothetical protein